MSISTDVGTWIAALTTIAVFSFAYGDNKIYRLFSSLFVGVAAGHAIVVGVGHVRSTAWQPLVADGKFIRLIPIIGGVLLLLRLVPSKKVSALSRLSLSFMGSVSAVVAMQGALETNLLKQVVASMNLKLNSVTNIVILLATITTIVYFLFLDRGKRGKFLNPIAELGKYAMMLCFGYTFGSGIAGTITLLVGRMQFLLGAWLGIGG